MPRAAIELWDTWTRIAGPPAAFESPSAGFVLDWEALALMSQHRIRFATLTHAAGISSTGDPELDALLPFDEPYDIPSRTADLIARARTEGARIVAIGTTVVRALEHAAAADGSVRAGEGLADERIGPETRLRVVDAILSGTHEPGTSHYELLRAFVDGKTLRRMDQELNAYGYRTHEFGDSVLVERHDADRLSLVERIDDGASRGADGDPAENPDRPADGEAFAVVRSAEVPAPQVAARCTYPRADEQALPHGIAPAALHDRL